MDLQTNYLGLQLKNPIIISSSRLSEKIDNLKKMEQAGAAAIVMYSIFEEEIHYNNEFIDYFMKFGSEKFAESLTYFPNVDKQPDFLEGHLRHLEKAVKSVSIPIIGSLNAQSKESVLEYALKMQATGISAIELNLFTTSAKSISPTQIENEYLSITKQLKKSLKIPVSLKLNPYFTSVQDLALKLDQVANIDGLVLFNRYYFPDFDINKLAIKDDLQLSNSYEIRLSLRWIARLFGQINASIAGSTGIESSDDIIKYILAGANVITCTSCLLTNGIEHITKLLAGLEKWMSIKKYDSLDQFRGILSYKNVPDSAEFERAQYMRVLRNFKHDLLY